jgi:hypothetical protein
MGNFPMENIFQEGDLHMRLKNFLMVNAVIAVVVGILMIFIPSIIVQFFGLPADNGVDLDGQLYGSELILMGLVAWVAREITELKHQRSIFAAFTIANLVSLIIAAIGIGTRSFSPVGWLAVAAYLVLTVVYAAGWLPGSLETPQPPERQIDQPS